MKRQIYYITRSFYPYQKGGGPLMRMYGVKYLQELGWDVIVVMPGYNNKTVIIENNIIQIPFFHIQKLSSLFEKVGIYEDYLDRWVEKAYNYLKDRVEKDDILFSSSGGDLASIKLGSLLKKRVDCKFVINFRDPIVYTLVNNLKVDKKPHVSREKTEKKYISNADLIITSSRSFQEALSTKYPMLKDKIKNNYFGYMKDVDINTVKKVPSKKLRIAYSGSMRSVQKPELLYKAFKKISDNSNIELYFIGDFSNYATIKNLKDVTLIPFMEHDKYLTFMQEHIDVGFVSLANDYLGVCVPSKIYEYINLNLPILAALPYGDSMEIINDNGYGKALYFDDISGLKDAIVSFKDSKFLNQCKSNITKDREFWSMKNRIKELDKYLRELL